MDVGYRKCMVLRSYIKLEYHYDQFYPCKIRHITKLARWLNKLIEPIRKKLSIHGVRDSFETVELIDSVLISNKLMVSYDITSLFTNVPLEETVDIICTHHDDLGISQI